MEYRDIGKTGKKAGIIGLGCEHLDGKDFKTVDAVVGAALDAGINYFDCFMPGREVRENIARALGGRRDKVYIQGHFGSTDVKEQYDVSRDLPTVKKYFEDLLRIFGHIDFGMLFFVDTQEDYDKVFGGGIADYAEELKRKGDISHIGFGSHNPVIAKKVVETGLPEVMMFSINLAFDMCPSDVDALDATHDNSLGAVLGSLNPERSALYSLCESRGVGISVMKTLCAGKLLSAEHTPFSSPMTVNQCVHYALSRPSVFSTLLGCQSPDEIQSAISYLTATDEERDYAPFMSALKQDFRGSCVYCNHCLPCPSEIDIASVNRYLDIAKLDEKNVPPSIRSHYNGLKAAGGDCIACGSCEERCPFKVKISENMRQAAEIFGK